MAIHGRRELVDAVSDMRETDTDSALLLPSAGNTAVKDRLSPIITVSVVGRATVSGRTVGNVVPCNVDATLSSLDVNAC